MEEQVSGGGSPTPIRGSYLCLDVLCTDCVKLLWKDLSSSEWWVKHRVVIGDEGQYISGGSTNFIVPVLSGVRHYQASWMEQRAMLVDQIKVLDMRPSNDTHRPCAALHHSGQHGYVL